MSDHCNMAATERKGEGEELSLYSPQVCSKIGDVVTHVTVDFIQAVRAVGRKENRVTESHKWELAGCDVTRHKSNRNGSVWQFFSQYGELNVCLVSFHQSAANIRVIQDDQHGPRADDRSGKMLHLVGRQHGLVKAKAYK